MTGKIGSAATHRGEFAGVFGGLRPDIENAGLCKRGSRDVVTGRGMARLAGLTVAVGLVVEAEQPGIDRPIVACQTALVGHDGGPHREQRLAEVVVPHLTERRHLVREPVCGLSIHVAFDAGDAAVRTLGPCGRVWRHLMAGPAEGGLIGRLGGSNEREHEGCHGNRAGHQCGASVVA